MNGPNSPEAPSFDRAAVRGLVFDLDGTLIDSYAAITSSVNHVRERFGMAALPADHVRRMVGRGLERLMTDLLGRERVEQGVRLFREHYADVYSGGTFPLPGALDTLNLLHHRGYHLSVASNKPARFSEAILSEFGMLSYLDCVEGPDTAGAVKPEPAMVLNCLQAMGLEQADALYIGDMVLDVETADRAGLPVVLVVGGSSSETELRQTGRCVLSSLGRLLDLLP